MSEYSRLALALNNIQEELQKTNQLYGKLLNNTIQISSMKNTAGIVLKNMTRTQQLTRENQE